MTGEEVGRYYGHRGPLKPDDYFLVALYGLQYLRLISWLWMVWRLLWT